VARAIGCRRPADRPGHHRNDTVRPQGTLSTAIGSILCVSERDGPQSHSRGRCALSGRQPVAQGPGARCGRETGGLLSWAWQVRRYRSSGIARGLAQGPAAANDSVHPMRERGDARAHTHLGCLGVVYRRRHSAGRRSQRPELLRVFARASPGRVGRHRRKADGAVDRSRKSARLWSFRESTSCAGEWSRPPSLRSDWRR